MHQSDLAVHDNKVDTKVSTNQKHQNVEYKDGRGREARHPHYTPSKTLFLSPSAGSIFDSILSQ